MMESIVREFALADEDLCPLGRTAGLLLSAILVR